MLTHDAAADTQIATRVAGGAWLVEFFFASSTARLAAAPVAVAAAQGTFLAAPALAIEQLRESEDAGGQQITLWVPVTDQINIAAFVGPATEYRNRKLKLYWQWFTGTWAPVGVPTYRGTWHMQPVRIPRDVPPDGSSTGRIELPCTRSGWERARMSDGLRHTHQQHLLRFPGDMGLQYLQALIEQPVLWLSKRFQELP